MITAELIGGPQDGHRLDIDLDVGPEYVIPLSIRMPKFAERVDPMSPKRLDLDVAYYMWDGLPARTDGRVRLHYSYGA